MTEDATLDPHRLLGRIQALEEENADLRSRLAYAFREIELLRERVGPPAFTTAAPREVERGGVVPVTPAELREVSLRLHELLAKVQ